MRILVVDDEEDLCEILQFNLEVDGYKVDVAYSAEEALALPLAQYDLLLLDVMMGEISGFRMAKMIRENSELAHLPIIFLTAKDAENDLLTGFNIGADDYIAKPFSIKEVLARVRAVLRRHNPNSEMPTETLLQYDTLKLYVESKKVFVGDTEVLCTKKEFEMLKLLLENKNRVLSRSEILDQIWTDEVCVVARTIDVHITRLRKKVGQYGSHIVTRQGYGYVFES